MIGGWTDNSDTDGNLTIYVFRDTAEPNTETYVAPDPEVYELEDAVVVSSTREEIDLSYEEWLSWRDRDRVLARQAFKMEERRRWSRGRELRQRYARPVKRCAAKKRRRRRRWKKRRL